MVFHGSIHLGVQICTACRHELESVCSDDCSAALKLRKVYALPAPLSALHPNTTRRDRGRTRPIDGGMLRWSDRVGSQKRRENESSNRLHPAPFSFPGVSFLDLFDVSSELTQKGSAGDPRTTAGRLSPQSSGRPNIDT